MPPMGATNGRDTARVSRRRKPVVNGRTDLPALHRRLAGPVMPGDQQQHSVSPRDCSLEPPVDCPPGLVEVHPVKVEDTIRRDRARTQAPVPASIQGGFGAGPPRGLSLARHDGLRGNRSRRVRRPLLNRRLRVPFARERLDRRRHPRPQRGLLRAERPHGPPRPSATRSGLRRNRTCRPRWRLPRDLRPRTCRTGSAP